MNQKQSEMPFRDKHAWQALIFTVSNHFTHYKTILKFLILSFFSRYSVSRYFVTLFSNTPLKVVCEVS